MLNSTNYKLLQDPGSQQRELLVIARSLLAAQVCET
jgi:hypothetical protein